MAYVHFKTPKNPSKITSHPTDGSPVATHPKKNEATEATDQTDPGNFLHDLGFLQGTWRLCSEPGVSRAMVYTTATWWHAAIMFLALTYKQYHAISRLEDVICRSNVFPTKKVLFMSLQSQFCDKLIGMDKLTSLKIMLMSPHNPIILWCHGWSCSEVSFASSVSSQIGNVLLPCLFAKPLFLTSQK